MKIAEVSERYGISSDTLRYYERIGLIPPVNRNKSGIRDYTITQRVSDVAEARGLPMAQVALAWMLSKPVITTPIIGTTRPHHLDDAVASISVQLTPDEIQHLEEAYQPHPILGYVKSTQSGRTFYKNLAHRSFYYAANREKI